MKIQLFLKLLGLLTSLFHALKNSAGGVNNFNYQEIATESFIQSELRSKTMASLKLGNELSVVLKVKKQRQTLQGQKCLKWWRIGWKLITGCTTQPDPDGGNTEQEWCRMERDATTGNKDWGWCQSELDYDGIRQYVNDYYETEITAMNKMSFAMQKLQPVCAQIISRFKDIKEQQDALQLIISDVKIQYTYMLELFELLKDLKVQWEKVWSQIQIIEARIKATKVPDPSKLPYNCEGMQGYEEDNASDGFTANFYNNEYFQGTPIKVPQTTLRYDWQGQQPHPQINAENFSILFEGFFNVPISEQYTFYLEVDQGAQFLINDAVIIDHYTKDITKGQGDAKWGETAVSKEIQLNAGMLYSFKLRYWHSTHTFYLDKKQTYLKISWSCSKFPKSIIPDTKFFSQFRQNPLQIMEYQQSWSNQTIIRNFDRAFQDTNNLILEDVPPHYEGSVSLRLMQKHIGEEINFYINQAANVYIGVREFTSNPLSSDFESTGEQISVMKVVGDGQPQNLVAKESYGYTLYTKKFPKGAVKIPLVKKAGSRDSYILFVALSASGASAQSCGGEEQILTFKHADFKSCEESSKKAEDRGCRNGISGTLSDSNGNMWEATNENAGAWVEFKFKSDYQIGQIVYKSRDDVRNQASELLFEFSDKSKQTFSPKKLTQPQKFEMQTVITDSVRISVQKTFNQGRNVGGSFEIKGYKCDTITEKAQVDPNKVYEFYCGDTVEDHDEVSQMGFKAGATFKIKCASNCPEDGNKIFGFNKYTSDSMVCAAAAHSGAIDSRGGDLQITLVEGLKEYESQKENGLTSQARIGKPGPYAVVFKGQKKGKDFEPFVGQLVDVSVDQVWQEGLVKKVTKVSDEIQNLLVLIDGKSELNFKWPSGTIDFCSKKLPNRKCDKNSLEPSVANAFKGKVCFSLNQKCGDGFVPDKGDMKKVQNGMSYGWDVDMSSMVRCPNKGTDLEALQCYMLFPPHQRNECKNPNNPYVCNPAKWKMDLPNGTYKVTLMVIDQTQEFFNIIQINGQDFFDGDLIKNRFVKVAKEIKVSNGFIEMTSSCDKDCFYYWSRICSIEVEQVPEKKVVEEEQKDQTKLGCESITGGVCDDMSSDELHNCYWKDYKKSLAKANQCKSPTWQLVQIPENTKCPSLKGGFKCLKSFYHGPQKQLCNNSCPFECKVGSSGEYICNVSGKIAASSSSSTQTSSSSSTQTSSSSRTVFTLSGSASVTTSGITGAKMSLSMSPF